MPRQFQVNKSDLAECRIVESERQPLAQGEARVRVERFALTANNITYGVVGGKIGYWKFFPVLDNEADKYGMIPVWGFGEITESNAEGLEIGERFYGYFPMADELVMSPVKVKPGRFLDGADHRAELPPVYNAYSRLNGEPHYDRLMDDERMILFPLYATSFCLYDFLLDNDWFSADQVLIISASSKTAIGTAMALKEDASSPSCIALTSPGNAAMVEGLDLYAATFSYDQISTLDASKKTVIIDMSGNGSVLSDLHERLGDNMVYCSNVGVTHYDDNDMGPHFIRERSAMFFAPGHMQKRAKEWGAGVFEQKALAFWQRAAKSSQAWLNMETITGLENVEAIYTELLEGKVAPTRGLAIVL